MVCGHVRIGAVKEGHSTLEACSKQFLTLGSRSRALDAQKRQKLLNMREWFGHEDGSEIRSVAQVVAYREAFAREHRDHEYCRNPMTTKSRPQSEMRWMLDLK